MRGSDLCNLRLANPKVLLDAGRDLALAIIDSLSARDEPEIGFVVSSVRDAYAMLEKALDCAALKIIEDAVPLADAMGHPNKREELRIARARYDLAVSTTQTSQTSKRSWAPVVVAGVVGVGLVSVMAFALWHRPRRAFSLSEPQPRRRLRW